jgi:hypothetical protein
LIVGWLYQIVLLLLIVIFWKDVKGLCAGSLILFVPAFC